MQLILQTANVTADAKNCSYPNKVTVTNASELQEAVKMDHVCAKYKNNYRSIDNFLKSNVVVMDLDNDHTDDPDEWITAEKLEELLPDISYAVAPSRNHMVAKNGKAARPKYHVYFEIEEMTDAAAYAALKAAIHNAYRVNILAVRHSFRTVRCIVRNISLYIQRTELMQQSVAMVPSGSVREGSS